MRFVSIFSVFFFTFFSVAEAQTPDRISEIRSFVEESLEMLEKKVEGDGQRGDLRYEGEIVVEEVDGYYAITTPEIAYYFDKYRVEIGMIATNMMLLTTEGEADQWSVSTALPTPIFVYQEDEMIGQVKIGEQKISSLWIPDLLFWANADYELKNIEYNDFLKSNKLTIDLIKAKRLSTPLGNDLWNVDETAVVSDVSMKTASDQGYLKIGEMNITSQTKGFDPKQVKQSTENLEAIMAWSVENKDQANVSSVLEVFKNLMSSFTESNSTFSISDITLKDEEKGDVISIPDLKMSSSYINNENGYLGGDLSFTVDSVRSAQQPQINDVAQTALPMVFDFKYNLKNFPAWESLGPIVDEAQALQELEQSENPDEMIVEQRQAALQEKLTALLQEAGLSFTIEQLKVAIPTSSLDMRGGLRFEKGAQQGMVTDFVVTLSGLEETMQKSGQKAGPLAMFVPMITAMGEAVEDNDPNTKSVSYKYHVQLTKDGQFLVNGQDMSALMGAAGGAGAPMAPPAGIVNPETMPAPAQ